MAAALIAVGGAAPATAQTSRVASSPGADARQASERGEDEDGDTPSIPPPDYLRAFLWDAAFLLGGTVWYWIDDRNILDWDFDSWETRFSEVAYRFDNNEFPINYIGHPLSGAAYYGIPRANRIDVWTSFLYAVLTSFVWEFFLEFQERFSLNDAVATPLGGLPIGESLVRLGRWLDNTAHPALAWTFGLPVALQELFDGRSVGVDGPGAADEPPGWADVLVDAGFSWVVPGGDAAGPGFDVTRVGAQMAFVALPGHLEPGTSARVFFDAEVTRLRADALFSSEGAGFELDADTILAGAHLRAFEPRGDGVEGVSAIVGTSVSHFYRFENYDPWNDRLSYTGFPGLAVQLEERRGPLSLFFDGRLQPLFGASGSATDLPRWIARHPEARPRSLVLRHSYWNGFGWLAFLRGDLRIEPFAVTAQLRYVAIDSQEGFDRNQADVVDDVDGWGELTEGSIEARLEIAELVVLRARWTHQRRISALDEVRTTRSLDRWELALGLGF